MKYFIMDGDFFQEHILEGVFIMSRLEEMYYDWSENQMDSRELLTAYGKLSDKLKAVLKKEELNEIDEIIMNCVVMERLEAFRGGFKQATEIWKECC